MTDQEQPPLDAEKLSHDLLMSEVDRLRVKSVTIRFAARRSIRAVGANGDEFRTAESEEAWVVVSPEEAPMHVDVAYASAMKITPLLIKKVMFDLVVAGVIKKEDAHSRIKYANESYSQALVGGKKPDGTSTHADQGKDQPALLRVGDPLSSSGEEPAERPPVSAGEDRRVPDNAGPGGGHVDSGPEAASGGADSRP